MNIALTWDLFILAFFVVVVAYNFIVGKNRGMKIVLSSYVSILAADGLGNLFETYLANSDRVIRIFNFFSLGSLDKAEVTVKVLAFVAILVLLVVRGGFRVHSGDGFEGIMGVILLLIYGFLSASLLISAVIVFVSGGSFISLSGAPIDPTLYDFYQTSRFARILIQYYDVWFILPAVVFVLTSFLAGGAEDMEE